MENYQAFRINVFDRAHDPAKHFEGVEDQTDLAARKLMELPASKDWFNSQGRSLRCCHPRRKKRRRPLRQRVRRRTRCHAVDPLCVRGSPLFRDNRRHIRLREHSCHYRGQASNSHCALHSAGVTDMVFGLFRGPSPRMALTPQGMNHRSTLNVSPSGGDPRPLEARSHKSSKSSA